MPQIDVEKLESYAQMIFERENQFNTFTLETIGRRIKATGQLSAFDQEALKNIADISGDMDKITKELARITEMNIADIEKIYAQIINDGMNSYKPLYDFKNMPFLPITQNDHAMKLVRHWAELTAGDMINLSNTIAIGFTDRNGNFTNIRGAFQQTIDDAVVAVSSGTTDFNSAMKGTIEQLGGSGVVTNYGSGVTRSLTAMVRQNLLWGAKEAAQGYDDYVSEELGLDGFEVDAHAGCRPTHEFMQGKMYSYNGRKVVNGIVYEDGSEALERLKDYGCLHFKMGVLLGVSQPRYSQEELQRIHNETTKRYEYKGREKTLYEWKQTQRRLERAHRTAQNQEDIFKASGNNIAAKDYRNKANAIKAAYDDLTNFVPGLYDRSERMRTYFNSAKPLTGGDSGGIMKLASGGSIGNKKYHIREDKESVINLEKRIKEDLKTTIVDFSELMNADVTSELVDNIEKLQTKHGQRFNAIIAQRPLNNAKDLAWVTPSRELVINPDYFNSKEAMQDILEELFKNGMLPKGGKNIEYVAKHEYAHLVTMDEINNPKSYVRTLFGREKEFISRNAMKNPYEFASDYLAFNGENKTSKKLKRFFDWED